MICKYLLSCNMLPFHFFKSFLSLYKSILVQCSPIYLFLLLLSLPDETKNSKKQHLEMSESLLLMYSSRCFMVSGVTFKSLIHFEFIFVYRVTQCSSVILLHLSVQFSQHCLSKRLSFFPLIVYSCLLCHRLIAHISVASFLGSLFCSLDVCVCFCANTVQITAASSDSLTSGSVIPPTWFFFSLNCFGYLGFSMFPYTFQNNLFQFCEKRHVSLSFLFILINFWLC